MPSANCAGEWTRLWRANRSSQSLCRIFNKRFLGRACSPRRLESCNDSVLGLSAKRNVESRPLC